uniref:Uncharacterized protein n=1 Tax=Anguilla anguilla TaxID=7936 RepID=A0A0E9TIT3_ANGAN
MIMYNKAISESDCWKLILFFIAFCHSFLP